MTIRDVPSNLDGDKLSISNPIVYMQGYTAPAAEGITPSRSIGAVRKVEITFRTDEYIQELGFPAIETDQWNIAQGVEIAIVAEEETAEKMGWLTCGATSSNILYFGGQKKKPIVQCVISKYLTGDERTVYDIWKMVPHGTPKKSMELKGVNLMEYNFRAQYSTRTWVNSLISALNEHLLRYTGPSS